MTQVVKGEGIEKQKKKKEIHVHDHDSHNEETGSYIYINQHMIMRVKLTSFQLKSAATSICRGMHMVDRAVSTLPVEGVWKSEERSSCSPVCMRVVNVHITNDGLLVLMLVPTELNQITGIAAILTFPLDIEVVEAEEREAKEEEWKRAEANDAS